MSSQVADRPTMAEEHRRTAPATCPVCHGGFQQRPDGRPKTCSKACARALEWQTGARDKQRRRQPRRSNGYRKVYVGTDHPRADKGGYALEHLIVMEQMLGRPVERDEYVHHRNGVRDDNRPENLELWSRKDPPGQRIEDKRCPHCGGAL